MDSPHHARLQEINEQHIADLYASLELPPPSTVSPMEGGFNNRCFSIDNHSVLRITQSTWPAAKVDCEAAVHKYLHTIASIPVPKLIAWSGEETSSLQGHRYILMEKIDGQILADNWDSFSEETQTDLLEQLADIVKQLQDEAFSAIGSFQWEEEAESLRVVPFWEDDLGPYQTTASWMKTLWAKCLYEHRENPDGFEGLGIWEETIRQVIYQIVNDELKHAKEKSSPVVMIHGDLNFRNIIVQEGRIVGLLDWEWAAAKPFEAEFLDSFEEIQEKNLMPQFTTLLRKAGGRVPQDNLRANNRLIGMQLCAQYTPWYLPLENDENKRKEMIEECSSKIEKLLDQYYKQNPC